MQTEKFAAKRSRVHTQYKRKDGAPVPGVTTVLGVLNKPALLQWAWKLGLAGIDMNRYRDSLADVGTIAHAMILAHLKDETLDTTDYPPNLVDKAENCLLSYFEWERQHKIQPLICETPMVSEIHGFGGTPDFFGYVDGVPTLLDFKTGKAIYDEYFYQLAAYEILLIEHNAKSVPQRALILQIGRDETEGFSTKEVKDLSREWEIFLHCLGIYQLTRRNGKN